MDTSFPLYKTFAITVVINSQSKSGPWHRRQVVRQHLISSIWTHLGNNMFVTAAFISHMQTPAVEGYSVFYSAGIVHSHIPITNGDLWQTRNLSVYLITYSPREYIWCQQKRKSTSPPETFKTTIHSKSYANVLRGAVVWICYNLPIFFRFTSLALDKYIQWNLSITTA